ncbi:hypothetical protein RATSFB_0324 [Candidatus Arthromitus sp. SFB-rat-Yit]|nr:hypothetical protein [Candidatus Arthromitus sp. SFB-rat-Yit]BAK80886.1 hypothetical protein RATSFB_0324 [Candidatus Arthromitus sp. SFB-rat-Yit]
MSNINSSRKPKTKPAVPKFLCEFKLYSGMISSTTVIIIVPAAKANIIGIKSESIFDRSTPIIPPMGSRSPGIDPSKNDFRFEYFSFLKGIDRANPSIEFCNTMDKDNATAPAKLPRFSDLVREKAIPMEIPSIKFLKAEDKMSNTFFFEDIVIGSCIFKIILDMNLSNNLRKIAPNMKPKDIPSKLFNLFLDNSVAGIISDHIDDEIMIPAVKPKNIL